ncbi:MAG TPA: CAP domain-containing protein, partial [Myxococcota bacterium]|nr:CAP domain-containing protein [Myxococcota bacterium]
QLGQPDVNSVGIAAQEGGVVVALSRRLVRLVPTPARVAPGAETFVAGRAQAQEQVTVAFGYPNGVVHRVRLPTVRGTFMQRVAVGVTPGIMDVQVLVDRGHGPEVAAQFPVGVGRSPWEAPEPVAATSDDGADPRAALWSLLWGARDAQGLALPTPHGGLARVAQAHADDMSRRAYFAHLSPTTGDVTDRLRAQGIAYVRVLENIAAAPSIDEAFAQWLRSPSHRANLLDPDATFAGVGVARGAGAAKDLVVLVMARLPAS